MSTYQIINDGVIAKPLVSVALLTYNHGKFIGEAIESALIQNTSFDYEIVIADDFSTDNTRSIITEYQKRYKQKIKLLLQDKNVGANHNELALFANMSGKYIAFLEGDDYWMDPLKLQKQVDFLEKNEDFSSCFHNIKILSEGALMNDYVEEVKSETTIYDLAKLNYIHTCSYLFRRYPVDELPEDYENVTGADYFLFMWIAKYGKIKKLPEIMAVYRRHGEGIWSSKDSLLRYQSMIKDIEVLLPYFDDVVTQILRERHAIQVFYFIMFLAENGLTDEGKTFALNSIDLNAKTIFKEIRVVFKDKFILSRQQKSFTFALKNTFKLIKSRLTRYFFF
jgi:glycosyltransferase involved in cell wall biosynthesis